MGLGILAAWARAKLGVGDERGANLVEYVMLLCFIALIAMAAVIVFGGGLRDLWQDSVNSPEFT
jgi:Flp pilus assembly pilin Flp